MYLGAVRSFSRYPVRTMPTWSRAEKARQQFELVQENIAKQREEMRRTQPHGLTPSSRWSSYSGQPLPPGTHLAPQLQAALNMGKGVIARWSPEKQLWISAI